MRILVYGSQGWIGNQFIDILKTNKVDYICGNSRVDNDTSLLEEINTVKPTHIVSFIGRTHGKIGDKIYTTIDYLEQKDKLVENIRDNLYSPLVLSNICKINDIHFTYLGMVAYLNLMMNIHLKKNSGLTKRPYQISLFFAFVVKGYTDRLLKGYDDVVLNLRIRMPITGNQHPRNFITKISTYDKVCSIGN